MLLLLLLCRRHFRSSSFHVCLYPVVYSRYPTPRGWPTSPRTVVEDRYDASCSIGGRAGRYYRSPPSTKPISVAARLITRSAVVTYAACKELGLDNVTVCSSLPSTTEPVIRLALFCPSVRPSVCLSVCVSVGKITGTVKKLWMDVYEVHYRQESFALVQRTVVYILEVVSQNLRFRIFLGFLLTRADPKYIEDGCACWYYFVGFVEL